jgi:RNA polymerase-binding transcription factor DksA
MVFMDSNLRLAREAVLTQVNACCGRRLTFETVRTSRSSHLHYHYLTIEQRQTLEQLIRSQARAGSQLDAALMRLHQPDYGVCIECGKDIGFERLETDPSALHCRACARLPVAGKR